MYSLLSIFGSLVVGSLSHSVAAVTVQNDNPFIHYNGRWDLSPGTWWTGSGFKLNVSGLSSLTVNLGAATTSPLVSTGVSVNYGPFVQVNMTAGSNVVPLNSIAESQAAGTSSVIRINAEGWQNNRINLESIELNEGAQLLPYHPSSLAFQFIGDSLSAGQYVPQGVDQAWNFLTGEYFKAEHNTNAQPGAALSDIVAYGNQHGVSYQYFKTEDTGYYDTTDHNYTTPWYFVRDFPQATHVVIHIGANDASYNISATAFVQTYLNFVARLRTIYREQPIFVFTPWGWPNPDGTISQYYQGSYQQIVEARNAIGDENVFLVNTTGWVSYADVYPANQHPNVEGHQKIAGLFETWLEDWGLQFPLYQRLESFRLAMGLQHW